MLYDGLARDLRLVLPSQLVFIQALTSARTKDDESEDKTDAMRACVRREPRRCPTNDSDSGQRFGGQQRQSFLLPRNTLHSTEGPTLSLRYTEAGTFARGLNEHE